MNKKRFEYSHFTGYISDELSLKRYNDLGEIADLLNQESDRADHNAEKLFEQIIDASKYKDALLTLIVEVLPDYLELQKILKLYGIKDLKELDHICDSRK